MACQPKHFECIMADIFVCIKRGMSGSLVKQTKWLLHSKKPFKTQTTEVRLNQTFWRSCFVFHLLILDGASFIVFYFFKSYYTLFEFRLA